MSGKIESRVVVASSSLSGADNPTTTAAGPQPQAELKTAFICRRSSASKHGHSLFGKAGRRRPGAGGDPCAGAAPAGGDEGVSARKLAARLWTHGLEQGLSRSGPADLRFPLLKLRRSYNAFQAVDACPTNLKLCKRQGMRSNYGQVSKGKKDGRDLHSTPSLTNDVKINGDLEQSRFSLEQVTKWDYTSGKKNSDDSFKVCNGIRNMEDRHTVSVSVVTALKRELDQAHNLVRDLQHAQRYSRKEVDRVLKKIAEERSIWHGKEQEKVRAMIRNLKDDLYNERKERKRLEVLNGKLAKELAEAKITAMKSLQDLEKERKDRKLMEDVCNELAREIGEDKAQVEELKRESLKVREEVEEERKMLQMAEVWREERVQMKLVEAKLALEEKSAALDKLREGLEAFINSRVSSQENGVVSDPVAEVRDAELLRQAANSIQIHDIKEFSYEPPSTDDIFSAFEELNQYKGNNEISDARVGHDLDEDNGFSSRSTARVHTVTPRDQEFSSSSGRSHQESRYREEESLSPFRKDERPRDTANSEEVMPEEEDSEWDYASERGDHGSSLSSVESKTTLNGVEARNSFSGSVTEWEDNGDSAFMNNEIDQYSTEGKTKKFSAARFWRKGDGQKGASVDKKCPAGIKGSYFMASPGPQGVDGTYSPSKLGAWSSPDSGNPHIVRGIKGFIEWPRGIQKNTLKAKLLEAKMESQKSQLRHVLKQRH
eukprot:TRINITY_DN10474_c0_g1_i1.p1 TRINITY_DN10474_c0_g1~~TRINITY_DN10474_c0_g1_i1.p1  ORF type:complete len:716 (+),score=138.61 TRINITY_DN10474_c0_g1_i1:287-2434(+)